MSFESDLKGILIVGSMGCNFYQLSKTFIYFAETSHVPQKPCSENEPGKDPAAYYIAHLGSILTDYRKAKFKCIALAEEMKEEIPNRVHFDSVERETVLKMELLDLQGLVALKNTLMKSKSDVKLSSVRTV